MSESSGKTLFEKPVGQEVLDAPLLFVTNRYNLLEFLSAGYALPVSGISKYYADLLELCPGRLPLLRGPVSLSVAATVSKEDPSAFPVALSVDSRFAGKFPVPSLGTDGTVSPLALDGPAAAFAPAGLLPLQHVRRVHFRTQEELDEHTAREYENVRTGEVELVVSADLFAGSGIEIDDLRGFLAGLEPVNEATTEFFDEIDRVNGARAMLAALCPAEVESVRAVGAVLAGEAPSDEAIPSWLTAALEKERPESSSAEARLFAAAADVLRVQDRSAAWRPLEVLARIEEGLAERTMSKKDQAEIARNLRPIRAILRNERDFKPFGADAGLDAAKALLLVLLRPDPDRICSWARAETGAGDEVMMAAGTLVGLLRGHKKLSLGIRSPTLDRLLANRASSAAAEVLPDALRPATPDDSLTVNENKTEGGGAIVRLSWGDQVVIKKVRNPPSFAERLLAGDLGAAAVREVALNVCRAQGWSDCVSTTIVAPSGQFAVDTKAKSVRITTSGYLDVGYELHEAEFRRRLSSEGLPAELETELQGRFDR